VEESRRCCAFSDRCESNVGEGLGLQRTRSSSSPAPLLLLSVRSATRAHNHQLVGVPDQGVRSNRPETKFLAVGRTLGSIKQYIHVGDHVRSLCVYDVCIKEKRSSGEERSAFPQKKKRRTIGCGLPHISARSCAATRDVRGPV
jgi:hypothetical protein